MEIKIYEWEMKNGIFKEKLERNVRNLYKNYSNNYCGCFVKIYIWSRFKNEKLEKEYKILNTYSMPLNYEVKIS